MKTITNTANLNWKNAVVVLMYLLSMNISAQKLQAALTDTWENNEWSQHARANNSYDASGFLTNTVQEVWNDASNSWQNGYRILLNNNEKGKPISELIQIWNLSTNDWQNSQRINYTYTASGDVQTILSELFVAGTWQNLSRETNSYDLSGYLVQNLYEIWNSVNNRWKNETLSIYNNNSKGKPQNVVVQSWNPVMNGWENTEKRTYTYNPADKIQTEITETMNAGSWKNFSRDTFEYDANGLLIGMVSQNWENNWQNDMKYSYSNNDDGTLGQTINQSWVNNVWQNDLRFSFIYEPTVGTLEKPKDFSISPNPADDKIVIKTNGLSGDIAYEITDQTGRNFQNGLLASNETIIDIHPLASGIYIIRFGHEKQQTVRMIKK